MVTHFLQDINAALKGEGNFGVVHVCLGLNHRYIIKVDCSTHVSLRHPLKNKGASSGHKTKQAGLTALTACRSC